MDPQRIIRNYLLIAGLYTLAMSVIWGVNTLFLLDAGLNIQEVFLANAAFSAGMFLFEIPTGVIADVNGRRFSFLLGVLIMSLGTLGYVALSFTGGALPEFIVMSALLGLGFTFYSGAVEAWLVDALNASGYTGDLDQVFARSGIVTGAAMLLGTVGGGFLGQLNLAWPFVIRAVLLLMLFVIAFVGMHDIGYERQVVTVRAIPRQMRQVAGESFRYGWQMRPLRMVMIVAFIQGAFFNWAFYAAQPYLLDMLGQDAIWLIGVITAFSALGIMAGNALTERLTRFCGKRSTLFIGAIAVQVVAAVALGLVNTFWIAAVFYIIMVTTYGVITPVQQAFIHNMVPSRQRATIVSFAWLMDSGGGILGQPILGAVSQSRSIGVAYILGGLLTALSFPFLFLLRRLGSAADIIIGRAGEESSCAAQGLPAVSGVASNVTVAER